MQPNAMAPLMATIKTLMAAMFLTLTLLPPCLAASFTVKRGLNLDEWTTWIGAEHWGERDAMLPFPEWRKFVDEKQLRALRADGFDFLRMPVDPSPFLSDKTLALRDALFDSVLESVRLVNRAGLKVLVDLHLTAAGSEGVVGMNEVMADPAMFDRYLDFVRAMAHTLSREDPEMVALEPMNEPVVDCDGDDTGLWPERLKRLFAAARASAPRLTLVLSGACYANADALAKVDPAIVVDDNVVWTFHSYQPFLLTHQGATWAGDFIPYVTGLPYPLTAVPRAELDKRVEAIRRRIKAEAPLARRAGLLAYLDEQVAGIDTAEKLRAEMEAPFEKVAAWANANGIRPQAILLGEFGMIRQEYGNPHVTSPADRAAYVRDMITLSEKHGFSWSIWGYGGAFGIVDAFDGDKAEPAVMDMIRKLPAPPQ